MRDIKFRGFNHDIGWVYGMYVDSFIVDDVVEATDEYIALGRWCPVDIDTVGQYTGLKDKNDVEIYEGDICKVSAEEPYSNNYFVTDYNWEMVMYIDFRYGAFQLREVKDEHMSIYYIETQDMDIEVIGNVYENPELF